MIKSNIIVTCINELVEFSYSLLHIEGNDKKTEGYNCAIDCVKDSLKTRIDSLSESLKEYDPQDKIDEKCECYNEIASMLTVLNADCKSLSNSEFDSAFGAKMTECIKEISLILQKYS